MFDKRFDDFLIKHIDRTKWKKKTHKIQHNKKYIENNNLLLEIVQAQILFKNGNPCLFSILQDTIKTFPIAIANKITCNKV